MQRLSKKSCATLHRLARRIFLYPFFLIVTPALPVLAQVDAVPMAQESAFAGALPSSINFQHLLENKDVVTGEVQAFLQDSQGFMWIGAGSGLIRYDGYEFKFILQTAQGEEGVKKKPVKMVSHIYEDKEKNLWISTRTGLLRYDPRKELLTPIPDDADVKQKLSTANVSSTIELPSGELMVSTGIGVFVLDKKTSKYYVLPRSSIENSQDIDPSVKLVYIDTSGLLWLGTAVGLERLDWVSKKSTLFKPYPERPHLLEANTVNDIVASGDGKMWVGTAHGLVNFDPVTLKTVRYVNDPKDPRSFGGKEISKLMVDSVGALWITSNEGGVCVYQKTSQFPQGTFTNHRYEPGRLSSLNSNLARTVYEDRTGDVWVGNYPTGINYFDRSGAAITSYGSDISKPKGLSNKAILAVREDAKGNFWLGTDGGGLNYFDRATGRFSNYQHSPQDAKSLSGNAVLDVFIDADNTIWVGTWGGGISVVNPATGKISRMPFDDWRPRTQGISTSLRLNNATVWSIKEDRKGTLWIGTHRGGLSKFDRRTRRYTHYENIPTDPTSLAAGIVWNTLEDSSGRFWVGTSTGLDLMDREHGTFSHFTADLKAARSLSNPSVTAIFEDSKKRLWIGTEAGLNLLSQDGKSFTTFTTDAGFIDDSIRTILEDGQGRLWLATNNGISVFHPDTKEVKNYNRNSGRLIGGFHTDSGLVSRQGEVVFGGDEGLRIFDPIQLQPNKIPPPIALVGLRVLADPVKVGDADGLLPEALNFAEKLVLDHQKSTFQISFSALNFRDSSRGKYAYRLEGYDTEWLQVDDERTAKYTNLDAGTYVFHVKGSNNDGIWNERGASLVLVQLPPPWKTWWAFTLYAVAVLGMAALAIHVQGHKRRLIDAQNRRFEIDRRTIIEEQNRLLEGKVVERTEELRSALETVTQKTVELSDTVQRLQQLQRDLVQAEKLASLGSLVAGVSHELNTPIGNALTTATSLVSDTKDFKRAVDGGGITRSALDGFTLRAIEMGDLLERSCRRAANLISSFKQVAVDQTSEHRRPFDLLELVNDNVTSSLPSLHSAQWSVEVAVPQGIACDSYPGPLGQVVTNLIQNAAIHAFENRDTGLLHIGANADADTVEVVFTDNGHGMSAHTLEHIFDPFYTTKLGKGGSGLGLAICQNMVAGVLGGQMSVSSEVGIGSRFVLRFPRIAPATVKSGHAL